MRPATFILNIFSFTGLLCPLSAKADLRLYDGYLDVITTSGKACKGVPGKHHVSIVLGSDDDQKNFNGILGGTDISVGRLSGAALEHLALRYPYFDASVAEGHTIALTINGNRLTGKLHDKHVDATAEDCNFDLAMLDLKLSEQSDAASTVYQQYAAQYEAQLARSEAISLLRSRDYSKAALKFEEALTLADTAYPANSSKLDVFLTGLANSYMRLGRFADYANLYDARYPALTDDTIRMIFNNHQIKSLLHLGRAAMGREEYPAALEYFKKAFSIDHNNKDVISAVMSAYVRSGQHDDAIAFLEHTEKSLKNDPDRRDVRGAIALVQYLKASKEEKAGRHIDAEAALLKAISLDPETVQYPIILARWRHKSGHFHEADTILKKAAERFKDEASRSEIAAARDKLRMTEMILNKIRRSGG